MKIKKKGKLTILVVLFTIGQLFGQGKEPIVFQKGEAKISFSDHLHHEFYWWPQTLLSYPIVSNEKVPVDELILVDGKSGKQVPFQLSTDSKTGDGKFHATLFLMTDLPSGGSFDFILKKGKPEHFQKIDFQKIENEINIKTDKLSVWLPASQNEVSESYSGPVLAIAQLGKNRMGNSQFNADGKTLLRIENQIINQGPLFTESEIRYYFTDNSIYQANVRCIKGYDFIELKEEITGFEDHEKCSWTIDWDNFDPTHRQAPNHPYGRPKEDGNGFTRFDWETIDQNMLNSHHGITFAGDNGKIPFEVGIYGNWPAERTVTSTLFWDEKAMQSVGAFTQDVSSWDDQEYAIWHNSGKINIKFYYQKNKLKWVYPLYSGTRTSAISCYPHQNDIDYMDELERLSSSKKKYPRAKMSQLSYNTFLQNRHSTIDLNRVKSWDLSYPKPLKLSKIVFQDEGQSVSDLEKKFLNGGYSCELPISGPCQNSGYSPVPARSFYEDYVSGFNVLLSKADDQQRERLCAMFLVHAYTAAGEEYMPMRTMLSGHPNFLADVKGIPALAAFLFPEHTEASNWSDLYEKYVDFNTHYHTRPTVKSWGAQGGRWTENLGTYTWAFLRPTVRANFLLQEHGDGKNRLANEQTDEIGTFVLSALSAPYDGESLDFYRVEDGRLDNHSWGVITPEKGPARVHPPQGAHSMRRRPPSVFWRLGMALQNYDPLLSENIRYISRPDHDDMEALDRKKEVYKIMYPESGADKGTPPDFHSAKLTGYGIVLRAAVGTEEELSVHLQQIDAGPNYRWGLSADGGCGTIYFYAGGKSYSHNGKEDIGDRRIQDTDMITNFGAFKDGRFKAIGQGELTRPMYDFSVGQFAEIVSSKKNGYSWPEYQRRSVMLVGRDYFLIYDDVYNQNMSTRFSWFTHPDEELPELNIVKGGGAGYTASKGKPAFSTHSGHETKGVWYDGTGDFLTFVSHKKGFTQTKTDFGCVVDRPDGFKDYIFRNDQDVKAVVDGFVFDGTAGLIRQNVAGQEWALFHGTKIGNETVEVQTSDTDAGLSLIYLNSQKLHGEYLNDSPSELVFSWKDQIPSNAKFYIDGKPFPAKREGNSLHVKFPEGKHIWTITPGQPTLLRPEINFTNNKNKQVIVDAFEVAGAMQYELDYSLDGVNGWTKSLESKTPAFQIKPVEGETKGYIRIRALNDAFESMPSVVYPVYFTSEKPHFPDGLKLKITKGENTLSWGKVMGCPEYRLYKREKGNGKFNLIYKGKENHFIDKNKDKAEINEYAVTSVNGNGESKLSGNITNDPDSWLNFDPMPGELFRRSNSKWKMSDNLDNETELYYPE